MRIKNLTHTPIILALGTERLYLKPNREHAIVRWTQNQIGMRHIEFGAPRQCLQVSILSDASYISQAKLGRYAQFAAKTSPH